MIKGPNVRSLMDFAMQANAAEMTRLAACMAAGGGVPVLMTVHDAVVAEAPISELCRTPRSASGRRWSKRRASSSAGSRCASTRSFFPIRSATPTSAAKGCGNRLMEVLDEIEANDGSAVA